MNHRASKKTTPMRAVDAMSKDDSARICRGVSCRSKRRIERHRSAFIRLLNRRQEITRVFVVVVFVALLGAPLTFEDSYAMPTNYLGAHMSKMPSANSKHKHLVVKAPAGGAAALVGLLLERIWMTEYHGHPIDRQSGFRENCIDQIERSISQKDGPFAYGAVRSPSDIPFDPQKSAKSKRVWEFRCGPIKTISKTGLGGRRLDQLEFQILAFNGVEKVVPAMVEILRTRKLGRYRIRRVDAERMAFDLVDVFPILKHSSRPPTISLLATYPFLDTLRWLDTPKEDVIHGFRYLPEVFLDRIYRLSNTGLLNNTYEIHDNEKYISLIVPLYKDFY